MHFYVLMLTAKDFVQCKISDSTFDECVRNGLQNAIPHLAIGNRLTVYSNNYKFPTLVFPILILNYYKFEDIMLFRYSKTRLE